MKKKWWHDKIAYEIYPKSFMDSNGDGIGDLKGIISKLDYLKKLGIDIIWLCPIYQSPFVDQGYDISDYYEIAKEFGTLKEFDELLLEARKRGMYVLMDLVINHCSNQHEWFQKALADPDGEYANYFYFVKGKNGKAPSNYRCYFSGSTWEPVPGTEKYYFHMFSKEQPDLNWENPRLRKEIYKMINWWLERGVAGFRIDAIINVKKDTAFPSFAADGSDGLVTCVKMVEEVQGVGDILQDIKKNTFEKYDAFTVAEVFNMKENELKEFVGENGHFSTMFDFSAHVLTAGDHGWYDSKPNEFKKWRDTIYIAQQELEGIGFWANVIENHDEPRSVNHFLPEYAQNEAGKKTLAVTSTLLRGIPFIYQGQEIGMTNCRRKDICEYDDLSSHDQYQLALEAGCTKEEALQCCYENSRDNARTPMQWSSQINGGFTDGTPWLGINPNYHEINVEEQEGRKDSVLSCYRSVIALRKAPEYRETFTYGRFVPAFQDHPYIFAYHRLSEETGQDILIVANYGCETDTLKLKNSGKQVLLSSACMEEEKNQEMKENNTITLHSCEAAVVLM